MKSPIDLLQLILTECGNRCRVSTDLDFKTIKARFEAEGFSYLAISLAKFGKDFEKSLDQKIVSSTAFLGYKKSGKIPALLQGFLRNVFDPSSGVMLDNPCIECIRSVRQVSLMWAKVNAPATPDKELAAMQEYIKTDQDVLDWERRFFSSAEEDNSDLHRFRYMFGRLFGSGLKRINRKVEEFKIRPSHGPGATADRLGNNQRWKLSTWSSRLDDVFPYAHFAFTTYLNYLDEIDTGLQVDILDPDNEIPVRVVSVPKTLSTPRIIAIEPAYNMFVQQALKDEIENEWNLPHQKNLPYHFVRYMDQFPNQDLARIGSLNGELATLDLSEASDRVSYRLVEETFKRRWPALWAGIDACRSRWARVGDIGIIPIRKFASMGSALTFPIESMVFLTLVFLGIESARSHPLTDEDFQSFIGKVRVYGDDIIVPVEYTPFVIHQLELFGAKVNVHKSFWNGKFRESCGMDFYDGENVNIVRLRREIPTSRRQVEALVSFVEFRNHLYEAGFWQTVKAIDGHIEKIIPFPAANKGSAGLCKVSFLGYESQKWDSKLQRPLVKAAVVHYTKRVDPLDGHGALLKYFSSCSDTSEVANVDPKHLQFAGRPVASDIMQRWIHPDYGVDVNG
jgi:hypothetical protein